jgi:hypothetical protein
MCYLNLSTAQVLAAALPLSICCRMWQESAGRKSRLPTIENSAGKSLVHGRVDMAFRCSIVSLTAYTRGVTVSDCECLLEAFLLLM